eukprot:sb/3465668/
MEELEAIIAWNWNKKGSLSSFVGVRADRQGTCIWLPCSTLLEQNNLKSNFLKLSLPYCRAASYLRVTAPTCSHFLAEKPDITGKRIILGVRKTLVRKEHNFGSPVYHAWYQFTAFYFWTSSCAFFLPYMVFKFFGMGDIKPVIAMLHNPVETAEDLDILCQKAARWLYVRIHAYIHTDQYFGKRVEKHLLFFTIIGSKIMYLINVLMTFWLTEKMFHIGSFIEFGLLWATEEDEPGPDYATLIQDKLFPKMASCEIKRWGTTVCEPGQTRDYEGPRMEEEQGMCVLPANVINQYLFLIFWGGLIITVFINLISLLISISNLCFVTGSYRHLLATSFLRDVPDYSEIWRKSGTSGRVILQVIARNVNPKIFEHVLNELPNK